MKRAKPIDLFLPVRNESLILRESVVAVHQFLVESDLVNRINVVVIENGSCDDTLQIANRLAEEGLCSVRTEAVGGVGLALRSAFSDSEAEVVGYMDIDLATDLGHLETLQLLPNSECPIVMGSRLLPGSVVTNRSTLREVSSRAFNIFLRIYLGMRVRDALCGFKFFRRDAIVGYINSRAQSNDWFFLVELLYQAEQDGITAFEIPVHWTDGNRSHVRVLPQAAKYARAAARLKRSRRPAV